jgi:hypothetical protein
LKRSAFAQGYGATSEALKRLVAVLIGDASPARTFPYS